MKQNPDGKPDLMRLNTRSLGARFYLNGFPKSGLHLLDQMMYPISYQMPKDWLDAPWVGMFQQKSFSDERAPLNQITFGLARIAEGYHMKGHCGYDKVLEDYMYYAGIIHLFVYRDLRDVAVSLAFHILNADNKKLFFPATEEFHGLGGFDEILSAVIQGHGEYPGVIHRWEQYAGWLDVDWVLSMKFKVLRYEALMASRVIIDHMVHRLSTILRMGTRIDEEILGKVVKSMAQAGRFREASPTFREGVSGSWKKHFTTEHIDQFKETDPTNWVYRLGFSQKEDWHA